VSAIVERADLIGAPPVVHEFIHFLETTDVPDGLFADDVFTDFTLPQWRIQAAGRTDSVGIRLAGHAGPSTVTRVRYDPTPSGFVVEVEEEGDAGGEHWYCRELMRADVREEGISALSVYCTGDWDSARVARHRVEVPLIRP
jgi:hypothetical protein